MSKSNDPAPTPVPAWLPRAIAVALVLTAVFEMTVWAARQLVGPGVLLLVSFFLSMVMEPAVSRLQARGMGRTAATLLVSACCGTSPSRWTREWRTHSTASVGTGEARQ
ncbi:hypothetical protein [Streptomyces sp. NPDC001714]|uniref:hypothetical protein n=1 Tax=Streptomyces sp. NPDC001714 TaxID=3364603 RepID=UPI0036A13E3F